ncbi:hypothetical protein DKP78_18370, partial [Enterococcus faecium]
IHTFSYLTFNPTHHWDPNAPLFMISMILPPPPKHLKNIGGGKGEGEVISFGSAKRRKNKKEKTEFSRLIYTY